MKSSASSWWTSATGLSSTSQLLQFDVERFGKASLRFEPTAQQKWRLFLDFCYQLGRLHTQRARDLDEFEHIHLAFTGFELPDERVRPFELCCQLPLRESRRFSCGHDDADEGTMSWTSQL